MKNRVLKKILIITGMLMLALGAVFLSVFFMGENRTQQTAVNGTIDLTKWNLKTENASLSGQWEFYWKQLLAEEDFSKKEGKFPILADVPKTWNRYTMNGENLPGLGYATYRLHVKLGEHFENLSLRVNTMSTSYRLYVNGKKIAANGVVGKSASEAKPQYRPLTVSFMTPGPEFDIIIQVSNYTYARGGIWYEINLGTYENIEKLNNKIIYKDAILMGSLLIMTLYYASFYFILKKDKSSKYFMFLSGLFIVRTSIYGDAFLSKVFPHLNFGTIIFLTYTSLIWITVVLYLMIDSIFYSVVKVDFKKPFIIYAIICTALIGILPVKVYTMFISEIEIAGAFMLILALIKVIRAVIIGEKGAILVLFAGLLLLFTGAYDVLYQANIVRNPYGEISSFGLFTLIFLFSFILASRFQDSFDENQRLSERLHEVDQYKDELLISTSHELKTPLHGIINISRKVLSNNDIGKRAAVKEDMNYIITVAKRLTSLIDDIIDLQSIKTNNLKINIKEIDISGPIAMVLSVLRMHFQEKGIDIINSVKADTYFVEADENRVCQILYNLIGNALKYTEHGSIQLDCRNENGFAIISVRDTGVGIREEEKDRIFQYYESYTDENVTVSSSGLGLPISKRLAEKMGGTLWLEKTMLGVGTEFAFKLPLLGKYMSLEENLNEGKQPSKEVHGEENPQVRNTELSGGLNITSILVVDDEITNIKVIKDIFKDEEIDILVAYNGEQALEIIKKRKNIALVLLDVMMPGMSGYELCRHIRKDFSLFELPVLLMTVRNSSEDIEAGFEAGANDYLPKPFEGSELKARVRTLLKMKSAVKNALNAEMAFLQSQIRPHFIYNALSVIMALCYTDGARAGKLLGEFSNYLRLSFDVDHNEDFVSLEKELSLVRSYVAIEKARFGERIEVSYEVDEDLLDCRVPALILQPLVENSIRHGLLKRIEGGSVKVLASKGKNLIVLSVEDNGEGMGEEQLRKLYQQENTSGVGLKNIQRRLKYLFNAEMEIDSISGSGTTIRINIPYDSEE